MRHRSARPFAPSRARTWRALVATLVGTLAATAAFAGIAVAAPAPSASSAAVLRAQADELAGKYFDTLAKFQSLDAEITRNQQQVDLLSARAKKARTDARARAVIAYKTSGAALSALINGEDSLDTSRRAHLIDNVNASDAATYAKLRATTRDLRRQQKMLEDSRQAQADALAELHDQGAAIDSKLAQAQAAEQAQASAAAVASAAATPPANSTPVAASAAADPAPTTTTTTAPPTPPSTPVPPPGYVGTPGVSPHHDDPFLSCVRQRESGGNYGAVNPAGPYLGAYQFLQSTWNVAANYSGRTDLVGVPVNVASPYDQDETAWALYQWQGAGPWGGSCP